MPADDEPPRTSQGPLLAPAVPGHDAHAPGHDVEVDGDGVQHRCSEAGETEALARATRGLDAFLAQEEIDYGDPAYDWSEDGAMCLAEGIREEGLGAIEPAPPVTDDGASALEAADEEVPHGLRALIEPTLSAP